MTLAFRPLPLGIRSKMAVTPAQCRAARALMDWTLPKLARQAAIRISEMRGFERGSHALRDHELDEVRLVLEGAGIMFVEGDGLGPGVRMRR